MATANSNVQLTGLDFDDIKNNLKTFLRNQDTLKDYNFDGSALSVLLDVLAYNTQYNAFYLNMVANEMFLDTALQRSSVVSHAKLLDYTPKSAIAPTAYINVTVDNVSSSSLTLPQFTNFLSESVDGVNYNFVTTKSTTVNTSANTVIFEDVEIKQGIPVTYNYVVDSVTNPNFTFEIPDDSIDASTVLVTVQESNSNSYSEIYQSAQNYLTLDGTSLVYFLQETLTGTYEIIFGDGIIGKKLKDGNLVSINYVVTQGTAAAGANNFVLMDSVSGFNTVTVDGFVPATNGGARESLDSIKFQAPKSYSAQKRAVTKEDYITFIQQNNIGLTFDAVNVWGGEENDPPVYGAVYICMKPTGAFNITQTQKQKLLDDVIRPISVMTVTPIIVDPDYTYIKINANVIYDPAKTTLPSSTIQTNIKEVINNFATTTLNTFDSTFLSSELTAAIKASSPSILTSEVSIQLQKKFLPNLTTPTTYKLYYGAPIQRGMFTSGVNSSPSVQFRDSRNLSNTIEGVFIEEIPSSTGGVESLSIVNAGFGYQSAPTVTILGDGIGATAEAIISATGSIKEIVVTNSGNNYTSAIATITPTSNDTTGQLGSAVVNLEGRFGTLRTYYNNTQSVKTILNNNAGTIDYINGIVTLNSFGPIGVDNPLGQLAVSVTPTTTIISSTYNRIITLDTFDPNAINVNVIAKK
jgi:hypothetical protein